jgi:hypothetical protein
MARSKKPDLEKLEAAGDVSGLIVALHYVVPEDGAPAPARERRREKWRKARRESRKVRETAAMALARCAQSGIDPGTVAAALVEATQQNEPEHMNVHASMALGRLTGETNRGFPAWAEWWREHEHDFVNTMREGFRRRRRRAWEQEQQKAHKVVQPPPLIAAYYADHAGGDAMMAKPPGTDEWEAKASGARAQHLGPIRRRLESEWQAQEAAWQMRDEAQGHLGEEHELPRCPGCHAPLRSELAGRAECLYCAGALT